MEEVLQAMYDRKLPFELHWSPEYGWHCEYSVHLHIPDSNRYRENPIMRYVTKPVPTMTGALMLAVRQTQQHDG